MFFGLIVLPNRRYSKIVTTPFHFTQAVLDVDSTNEDTDVKLYCNSDNESYLVCILNRSRNVQESLDLIFSEGDNISFRSVGGTIHLTGYYADDQVFPETDESGDSSDGGDDEEDEPTPRGKRRRCNNNSKRR